MLAVPETAAVDEPLLLTDAPLANPSPTTLQKIVVRYRRRQDSEGARPGLPSVKAAFFSLAVDQRHAERTRGRSSRAAEGSVLRSRLQRQPRLPQPGNREHARSGPPRRGLVRGRRVHHRHNAQLSARRSGVFCQPCRSRPTTTHGFLSSRQRSGVCAFCKKFQLEPQESPPSATKARPASTRYQRRRIRYRHSRLLHGKTGWVSSDQC